MPLNDINFTRNKSGLGTPLLSKDHISGICFYNDTLPTGFTLAANIVKIFSIEEAEDAGIIEGSADHAKEWYHINEFFQKNPKGELNVGISPVPAVPASHDFSEIVTIQTFAEGTLRQLGIYFTATPFTTGIVDAIQAQVDVLKVLHQPLNVLFGGDIKDDDLSALPDLRSLFDNNVSVCIGQDGNGAGAALFVSESLSITDVGAKLGAVSAANVHESIGWVEEFPMVTDGTEFETVAFASGDLYKNLSAGLISSLDDKGYLFMLKHIGISGTYNNDSYTATAVTSDLATIENNRTIDKAIRNARTFLLPKLSGPLFVAEDGTLTSDTIAIYKSLTDKALAQMEADGELSASQTLIDPSQNVLATSEIVITMELVPVGVARTIKVNIGFTPNLTA